MKKRSCLPTPYFRFFFALLLLLLLPTARSRPMPDRPQQRWWPAAITVPLDGISSYFGTLTGTSTNADGTTGTIDDALWMEVNWHSGNLRLGQRYHYRRLLFFLFKQ